MKKYKDTQKVLGILPSGRTVSGQIIDSKKTIFGNYKYLFLYTVSTVDNYGNELYSNLQSRWLKEYKIIEIVK